MCNSLSSFEIEVGTENCLVVISDPMMRVKARKSLSKDDKIFVASC